MNKNDNDLKQIAERLSGLRDALGMTVEQMAFKYGMTTGEYLRYESGECDIPLSFISRVAKVFGVNTTALLSGNEPHVSGYYLTRKNTGVSVERTKAYKYMALSSGFKDAAAEPFEVLVEPAADFQVTLNSHPGQEFNYVLEGAMLLYLGDQELILKAGDSIYFDSSKPHGMLALGGKPVKFLAVII